MRKKTNEGWHQKQNRDNLMKTETKTKEKEEEEEEEEDQFAECRRRPAGRGQSASDTSKMPPMLGIHRPDAGVAMRST